jgi:hypothetical protein
LPIVSIPASADTGFVLWRFCRHGDFRRGAPARLPNNEDPAGILPRRTGSLHL